MIQGEFMYDILLLFPYLISILILIMSINMMNGKKNPNIVIAPNGFSLGIGIS